MYIDLTHCLNSKIPVYPGTPKIAFNRVNTVEVDGFQETKIDLMSHMGTHMDAPAHMLSDGKYLNEYDISKFIGNAYAIDVSNNKNNEISKSIIKEKLEKIEDIDYLLLYTGFCKYFFDEKYFKNFPILSNEATEYIAKKVKKGIGIDAISVDQIDSKAFNNHNILLKNDLVIVENLKCFKDLCGQIFKLYVFPLKYVDADGAPVRAVAERENII